MWRSSVIWGVLFSLADLYLLFQTWLFRGSWVPLDIPDDIGHLNLVNWIELLWTVTLDLLRSRRPREKVPDREILPGIAESLLSGDWIRRNDLPCSLVCLCPRRVVVLQSVLHLVHSWVICRGFNLNTTSCSSPFDSGAEELVPYHYWFSD